MSPVAEQPSNPSPTGRLSQQPQPSASRGVAFVGGYLSPAGPLMLQSLDSTGTADNASSLRKSTQADEPETASGRIVAPVVPLPMRIQKSHVKPIQHWEGVVGAIDEDSILALLHDRHRPGRPEEAEFPLSDVADGDVGLVEVGAVFYWTIGYLVTAGGQRTRVSTIRFRRLPVWTNEDLRNAQARAAETSRLLDWS